MKIGKIVFTRDADGTWWSADRLSFVSHRESDGTWFGRVFFRCCDVSVRSATSREACRRRLVAKIRALRDEIIARFGASPREG